MVKKNYIVICSPVCVKLSLNAMPYIAVLVHVCWFRTTNISDMAPV
jgi:hypothetical protein